MIKFTDVSSQTGTNAAQQHVSGDQDQELAYVNLTLSRQSVSSDYEVLRHETRNTSEVNRPKSTTKLLLLCKAYGLHVVLCMNTVALLAVIIVLGVRGGTDSNVEWSNWGTWDLCSSTCGIGMQRRARLCSNPDPSVGDKYCSGEASDYRLCNERTCPVFTGEWNHWGSWESCSSSCGDGMQRRVRLCSDPKSNYSDKYCSGDSSDYRICNERTCPGVSTFSAFSVRQPNKYIPRLLRNDTYFFYSVLNFSTPVYQYGSEFNVSTGLFNCSVPGTYLFTVNLMKRLSFTPVTSASCTTYKLSSRKKWAESIAVAYTYVTESDTWHGSVAAVSSVVVSLDIGDMVFLSGCSDPSTTFHHWSSFSGVLLYTNYSSGTK